MCSAVSSAGDDKLFFLRGCAAAEGFGDGLFKIEELIEGLVLWEDGETPPRNGRWGRGTWDGTRKSCRCNPALVQSFERGLLDTW